MDLGFWIALGPSIFLAALVVLFLLSCLIYWIVGTIRKGQFCNQVLYPGLGGKALLIFSPFLVAVFLIIFVVGFINALGEEDGATGDTMPP